MRACTLEETFRIFARARRKKRSGDSERLEHSPETGSDPSVSGSRMVDASALGFRLSLRPGQALSQGHVPSRWSRELCRPALAGKRFDLSVLSELRYFMFVPTGAALRFQAAVGGVLIFRAIPGSSPSTHCMIPYFRHESTTTPGSTLRVRSILRTLARAESSGHADLVRSLSERSEERSHGTHCNDICLNAMRPCLWHQLRSDLLRDIQEWCLLALPAWHGPVR